MNTQEKIAELERQIAEIKLSLINEEEWPKVDDEYWVATGHQYIYENSEYDECQKISDNMFRTKEEAKHHHEMLKLAYSIRQKAMRLDEIDWDNEEYKYFMSFMSYNHTSKAQDLECACGYQCSRTNFKTQEECEEAFKDVSDKDFLYMLNKGMI